MTFLFYNNYSVMRNKSIVFLLLLLLTTPRVFSQVLFVENGVSLSSLQHLYDKNSCMYQMNVGIDYVNSKWYFLSSSVGFLQRGGKYAYTYLENIGNEEQLLYKKEYAKYLTINTLFNLKYEMHRMQYYLGVGPQLGINVGDNVISDYDSLKTIQYGLKAICGVNYTVQNILLGVNFSYLPTFGSMFESKDGHDKTFAFNFRIGYRL